MKPMKRATVRATVIAVLSLFIVVSALAQTNQNTVTFGIGPTGVKSFPGTDAFVDYAVTKNFQFRYDNYQVPGLSMSGNFAGGWYTLPLCNLLANTNLNCNVVNEYVRGSVGIWQVSVPTSQNYVGGCGGGGVNYSPMDNGVMSVNLIDVQACKTPLGVEPVYSLQLNLGLGVNGQNPDALTKARVRAQKRLAKLQAQAAKIDKKATAKSN
jgi:hypothetical protein